MNDITMEKQAAAILKRLEQAIEGMANDWPASQQAIVYEQNTYTPAQFAAKLQQAAVPLQAVPGARSALRTALNNRTAALPDAVTLIDGFYALLPQYLPPGADVTKFGSKTKKPRTPQTAEQKAAANAKRTATRAARHIMGKKQRQAIKAPPTPATPPPAGH
jgi:hypothetical protein